MPCIFVLISMEEAQDTAVVLVQNICTSDGKHFRSSSLFAALLPASGQEQFWGAQFEISWLTSPHRLPIQAIIK